jgi:hypothetical protein
VKGSLSGDNIKRKERKRAMSSKKLGSALTAGLVTVAFAACLGASAAAAADSKKQAVVAPHHIHHTHRLYGYAEPGLFAPFANARPGYTLNHDAWMRD